MKLLSIVIPTYNTEHYLARCLDSLLTEEVLKELEVIVVNDGSKDGSLAIAKRYAKRYPRTVTVIDKENGGHGSTINAGLKAAKGRYFRVLDSDDWFDTCNFVKYFRALRQCREDVVITPYTQEYAYNGQRVDYPYAYFKHNRVYQMDELEYDESMVYFTMASSTYRTELLRESGLVLFEKCFYVDMMFNMVPIPYVKTVRFLNYYVYRYFMGSPTQSMSQQNLLRNLPNHERVLNFLIDYYVEHRESVSDNVRNYMGQMIYFMYYTHMDLVCMKLQDRKKAYTMFRDLDESLRDRAPELYIRVDVFPYLRVTRRLYYLNIRMGNKAFVTAMNLAKRILRRG